MKIGQKRARHKSKRLPKNAIQKAKLLKSKGIPERRAFKQIWTVL